MDEADLVGVHEAGIAHHVAAVGQVDGEHRAAAVLHRRRAVVMQLLVVVGADVAAGENVFQVLREFGVNRHHVFEVAVLGAIFHHQDLAVALDDGGLDLADFFVHQHFVRQLAVENLLADFGHALRAQRIGGARPAQRRLGLFVGLEQRLVRPLGVGEGFGLMRFKRSNTTHAPLAAATAAFSTYFIGLCMLLAPSFLASVCSSQFSVLSLGLTPCFESWVFGLRKKLRQNFALASPEDPSPRNPDACGSPRE